MFNSSAIGIDLGSSYCCVSVVKKGKIEIILNEFGTRTTPSIVAFSDTQRFIGEENQLLRNASNTVFGVQRFVDNKTSSTYLKKSHLPYEIVEDEGRPTISVEYKNKPLKLVPEEVLSMLLGRMKKTAEKYLEKPVSEAVIAVPVDSTSTQRWAIIDAAAVIGLSVLRIINVTTAAAIDFASEHIAKDEEDRDVLVLDVGGATTSIALMRINTNYFLTSYSAGETLGGDDFTNEMLIYLMDTFQCLHNKDLTPNKVEVTRLRVACEFAKRLLSSSDRTVVNLESLMDGIDFHRTIAREEFENIVGSQLNGIVGLLKKVLDEACVKEKLDNINSIRDVILIGGTTRTPKLRSLVKDVFGGKELNTSLNPDESVARGAGLLAARINSYCTSEVSDQKNAWSWNIFELIPHDLGFEAADGSMTPVIRKNATASAMEIFDIEKFGEAHQGTLRVFEGENALVKDNTLIGELKGIPCSTNGVCQVEVTFEIGSNGRFTVSALDKVSGQLNRIEIKNMTSRLSQEDIKHMTLRAKEYLAEDASLEARKTAKNTLESLCYFLNKATDELKTKSQKVMGWIEQNQSAEKEEYESRLTLLKAEFKKLASIMRAEYRTTSICSDVATVIERGGSEEGRKRRKLEH